MRLTEKFSEVQMQRRPWTLYMGFDTVFGHVLDDKFEAPHIHVYEHTRHTFDEMFNHPPFDRDLTTPEGLEYDDLAREEREVVDVLDVPEDHRLLAIVGDVGVGKTTFLRHLMTVHFPSFQFGEIIPIYLDWKAFTAPLDNPVPAIHDHFVNDVFASLEKYLTPEEQIDLDDRIFERASLFARSRTAALRMTPKQRKAFMATAIQEALYRNPVEFAFERINMLCEQNRNKVVLIIDNIDQLYHQVLDTLYQFLIELQTRTVPLVIVAMRDHTLDRGFSAYRREATTSRWVARLHAPNIKNVLHRRLEYFFPLHKPEPVHLTYGIFQVKLKDEKSKLLCRKLLEAPFEDPSTYEFLMEWCNFNIRVLFR